jgi:hypothetical protein
MRIASGEELFFLSRARALGEIPRKTLRLLSPKWEHPKSI